MRVFETGVYLSWDLVTSEEGPDELFNLGDLEGTNVVSVDSIENVLGHLLEFIVIDQNIC